MTARSRYSWATCRNSAGQYTLQECDRFYIGTIRLLGVPPAVLLQRLPYPLFSKPDGKNGVDIEQRVMAVLRARVRRTEPK